MSHHHTISSEQNSATYLLEAAAGAQCSRAATAMAEEETAQAIGKGGQVRNIDTTSTTEKEVVCMFILTTALPHSSDKRGKIEDLGFMQ